MCPPGWYAWRSSCYIRINAITSHNNLAATCVISQAKPAEFTTVEELAAVSLHMGGGYATSILLKLTSRTMANNYH